MQSEATGLPPLREVIRALGLSARKSLGQNFILDLNLTGRIARTARPFAGATIIEVGPGPGGLTRALLSEGAERVIAVEKDARFLPALAMIAAHFPGRLEVVEADALAVDWRALVPAGRTARIIANLPYSVATPLLTGWLKTEPWPPWWDRMVLMFQREVAERIVAAPGGKAYGRLAVLSQWRAEVRTLFHLPPAAFTPPPKVASTLVEFIPRPAPHAGGERIHARESDRGGFRPASENAACEPEIAAARCGTAGDHRHRSGKPRRADRRRPVLRPGRRAHGADLTSGCVARRSGVSGSCAWDATGGKTRGSRRS